MKYVQHLTTLLICCLFSVSMQAQCSVGFQSTVNPNGVASFTSSISGFQQTPMGGGIFYNWIFYDNSGGILGTSTSANPTQVYPANGQYVACLTVSDSICTNTFCDSVYVTGLSNPCNGFAATFSFTPDTATPNCCGTFQSAVSGGTAPYSYAWNINGASASGANPYWQFAPNSVNSVCLVVTDASGCSYTYCDSVSLGNNNPNPCANFGISFNFSTAPATPNCCGTFQSTVSGGTAPYNYTWNINGASATGANPYWQFAPNSVNNACVVVTDANGCSATYCDSITLGNTTTNPCANLSANFTYYADSMAVNSGTFVPTVTGGSGAYQYFWTIGNATTGGQNPYWQFSGAGVYQVCLVVYDANGCAYTYCDSVSVGNNGMGSNPCAGFNANFTYTPTTGTNTGQFTSSVTGGSGAYQYVWTIGNSTASGANPSWQFGQAGSYNVCLTVYDANQCATTYCQVVTVGNPNPCNLMVDFSIDQDTTNPFVLYLQPNINGTATNPANNNYQFIWDFGANSGTIAGQTPSYQYSNVGAYVVCLTLIDSATNCTYHYCDSIMMDSLGNFSRNAGGFIINVTPANFGTVTSVVDQELVAENTVQVFPNPVQNHLNLRIESEQTTNAQLTVYNLNGQALMQQVINLDEGEQVRSLDVEQLPQGMYLLRIQNQDMQLTQKFIKR